MIQELSVASGLLSSALDRYLNVCLAIQKCYVEGNSFTAIPLELSSNVASQVQLIPAFESKLCQAKTAIHWSRNCSSSLVPIHALPPELLERIFQFVSTSYHRHSRDPWDRPEVLSHVCSRWRGLALNLPYLWSFIRLPLICTGDSLDLGRAVTYAERASPLLLNLQPRVGTLFRYDAGPICLLPFITDVSSRIRSLEFVISFDGYDPTEYDESALSTCLMQCKSGTLTNLVTCIPYGLNAPFRCWFFDIKTPLPTYLSYRGSVMNSGVPDDVMASITTLRLNGLYPFWTSKAYHGLVELRLVATNSHKLNLALISENHLLGILKASPGLRILTLDLEIIESHPEDASVVPVRLNYLESLKIGLVACQELGALLRWLAPGSFPLQLSIGDHDSYSYRFYPEFDNRVTSFFSRSNIKEVHLRSLNLSSLITVLNACPYLQTLALEDYELTDCLEDVGFPISHSRLESLYILNSSVNLPPILVASPVLKSLLFVRCDRKASSETWVALESVDLESMAGLIPDVRLVEHDPIHGWAVFDV